MKRLILLAIIGAAQLAAAQNWSAPVAVTTGAGDDHNLVVVGVSQPSEIWACWDRTYAGESDIYHAQVNLQSFAFEDVRCLTPGPGSHRKPEIAGNLTPYNSGIFLEGLHDSLWAIYYTVRNDTGFVNPFMTLYSNQDLHDPIFSSAYIEGYGEMEARVFLRTDWAVSVFTYIEWSYPWLPPNYQIPLDTAYQVNIPSSGYPVVAHTARYSDIPILAIYKHHAWEKIAGGRGVIEYHYQVMGWESPYPVSYTGVLSDPQFEYHQPLFQNVSFPGLYLEREADGNYEIVYTDIERYTGIWSEPVALFDLPGSERNLHCFNNILVFESDGNGNPDIAFWHPALSVPEYVDVHPGEDRNPYIFASYSLSQYHVFWESDRDGTWKIYYSCRSLLAIEPGPGPVLPRSFAVSVHPNPGNAEFGIDLELPMSSEVEAAIYDLSGRRVTKIHDGALPAGLQKLSWDASEITSGIYLLRVESADNIQTRKMVVLK